MNNIEKTSSISNLAKALIKFHSSLDKIKKDSKNPFFSSKYASLSAILESINKPLIESGISFTQLPVGENSLVTILMHAESGEYIQSTYEMRPVKDDPQGRGSVITYQRRYALSAVLGLNIDEDDDANAATGKFSGTGSIKGVNTTPVIQKGEPTIKQVYTENKVDNLPVLTVKSEVPVEEELELLRKMVFNIPEERRKKAFEAINNIKTYKDYDFVRGHLENAVPHISQVNNPSKTQVNKHLQKLK